MLDFKDFLDAAERDDGYRALIICKDDPAVKYEMQRLMDEAHERGLQPIMWGTQRGVTIGTAFAMFRKAHPFLDTSLHGLVFNAVYGMDYLNMYRDIDRVIKAIKAQIR
jgi:hypothetical protein